MSLKKEPKPNVVERWVVGAYIAWGRREHLSKPKMNVVERWLGGTYIA